MSYKDNQLVLSSVHFETALADIQTHRNRQTNRQTNRQHTRSVQEYDNVHSNIDFLLLIHQLTSPTCTHQHCYYCCCYYYYYFYFQCHYYYYKLGRLPQCDICPNSYRCALHSQVKAARSTWQLLICKVQFLLSHATQIQRPDFQKS